MTNPTIADLLKYADLQMAAEAFLADKDTGALRTDLRDALIFGNGHASRFTATQATHFLEHWKVVEQKPNTASGFSGTLFECTADDPATGAKRGDLVMSFRSTEFIDDSARDNQATNALEIKETGFAWGQVRDMEAWYQELVASGKLVNQVNPYKSFSVTGYSLGGHLASVFNEMHSNVADQVVTFNGAGIGGHTPDNTLSELIAEFASLADGNADGSSKFDFSDPYVGALFDSARTAVKAGGTMSVDDYARLSDYIQFRGLGPALLIEAVMLRKAVDRINDIRKEMIRLQSDIGLTQPAYTQVAQHDLDYQMAVLTMGKFTDAASLLGGLERAFGGKQYLTKQPNQFDIVGDTSPSAVANSQYHIGTDVRVFIEDQPLYRGSIGGAVAFQLLLYTGVKLLVNGYETKDFGDTHSLVLLVDSLNVQNTLLNMLPTTARATEAATVGAILKDASNLRAANGDLAVGEGQGKAEGDVLENTLNALADLVLGGQRFGNPGGAPDSEFTHLVGAEDGNLWWDTQPKVVDGKEVNSGRDRFYELLDEVQKSDFFTQANNGQLTLTLVPTANVFDLGQRARKDFGAYAALYSLSPFALLLGEGGISSDTNALLESAWGDVFKQWNADRELALGLPLSAGIPGGNVSDQWLSSRAELLKRKQYFNHANGDYISLSTTINLPSSASPFNGENIVWEDKSSKLKIQRGDVNDKTRYVIFGSDSADDVLSGEGNDDRLFGGAGDDQLSGGGGDDYLEGNSGNDLLSGGAGIDLLSGGTGNDTLSGGTGNDLLLGGSGNDELHGDDGKDFLNGGTGSDKLYGGEGNDYLFDEGGEETNTLKGDAGNDILEIKGGTGIALLDGGAGNDILIGGQGNNSLDGGAGNDSIQGGGDDDLINGGDDADYVDAGGGDDWIKGGKGADYLKGGAGSDTYVYDAPGFGVDLLEDNQGSNSLSFTEGSLGTATYDAAKMAWVAENGMEIRKYDLGGSTLLALGEAGDKLDTIYLRDWQPGQYGITLSGEETTRERPDVVAATLPTRAENNYVDLAYSDAADGGQGNDLLFGSAANSVLLGGSGNDIIDGAGGDDWLEGGEGTDFILTGSGRDVAYGGLGNDLIRAGGTFSMSRGTRAGTGEEVIFWDPSPSGFLYSDDETASQFYYYVNGQRFTAPHPELAAWDLEFTSNVYNSTNGPIRLWWSNADASNASLEPNLSIYLKVGDSQAVHRGDNLTAAPSADFGKAKSVVLSYGYGGEMLPPGTNAEGARLYGGGGDDVIYGANDNDKLYGEDDNDLLIGYDGDDELYGGKGKDELSGGAGRDFLDGGEGADLLVGGYGADVLAGGDGDDRLVGDAILLAGTTDYPPGMDKSLMGGDYLQGGAGNDMLWGNHGDDYLFGGADDDLVFGGEGDDHGFGEDGDDTLSGGQGGDFLDGGAGKDVLYGEGDGDLLLGGAGEDRLEGGDGDDILDGGADNDVLFGGSGQDNLRGGAGNDKLYGDGGEADDGADILEGGTGNDELFGGGKGDMYVFSKGDGQDVVNDDVADGSRNVIVFKFASDEVRMLERSGNDLLIKYGVDDQVTVKGYYGGSAFSLGSTGSGSGAGDGVEAESQPVVAEIRFEDGTVWGAEDIRALAPPPAPGELPPDPYAGLASIYFVNALLSREETRAAGKHSLSFSFANSFVPGVSGFREFDEAQKQAVREALSCFSAVLDLSFTELAEGAEADLTFHLDDLMSAGLGGAAGYAEPATGNIHLNSDIYAEQRLTELGELVTRGSLSAGNGGFEVLLHEIGHALGLKHPFEPPVLPNGENSTANTVMSYTSSGARATALAAFDVAALQYLYGVAPTVGSGNDVHTFGERWVQDSVGSDLFDASQETLAVSVDLTPGSWNFKGGKAASILADNQSFIGYGTVIENATGGTGNDTLIGNDAANLLLGGAGSDSLSGGLGDDTLAGGEGDDTLAGGAGSDLLQGGLGADTYAWGLGSGIDVVVDQSASSTEVDTLRIVGGLTPSDILLSRAGNDLVVRVRTGPESVTITGHYAGKGIERILFENGTQWDAVTIQANVTVGLTDADDYFQGTAAAETVDGRG
ncbi:MAG TPA: calcium-binding protein, partial [Roseateles sp.]|uniref:calcium-binding protein n=1 Tax=Roseateles sp. TaxID=1971397 RepID=UPI002ED96B17